jgi:hypothetical protein
MFSPRARTPKAPQPSRPYRSTGSAQTGAQFSFFLILLKPEPGRRRRIVLSARTHADASVSFARREVDVNTPVPQHTA